jgi:site-specific DNA recombinase
MRLLRRRYGLDRRRPQRRAPAMHDTPGERLVQQQPALLPRDDIEALAIKLRQDLVHPEVITEFVDAYNAERKRLEKEASTERSRIERRLGEIEREIKRIVDFIVKGTATDALIPRMNELEAEKTLAARIEEAKETDNVIALHPKALDR